jgi:protein TonB
MGRRRYSPDERLGIATMFALMVNAVLVLGLDFVPADRPDTALPTLDVILVQTATVDRPEKADFLAQAHQAGGGDSERSVRPSMPLSGPLPRPEPGVAPREMRRQEAARREQPEPARSDEALTRLMPTAAAAPRERPAPEPEPRAGAREEEFDVAQASLAAEINRRSEAYAKRPKRKFISANTREYVYAEYMAGWVAKVERLGNLNYPEPARAQGIHGSLVLTVAIRRDGSVEAIDVIQSSGHTVLDEAAIRIVNLARPFNPLPDSTRDEVDILHVTRTWQFLPGNVLRHD